jgi:ribosomal protein S18 acetylase RimI-like enzyme
MPSSTLPRLRAYRDSDGPFVEALARQAFAEYSPRAGTTTVRAATLPGTLALVAVVTRDPIGFAMLTMHVMEEQRSRFVSLDAIAVDAAHRGRGVGKALLAGAEREARKRRAAELRLVTAEANVAALDLFLRSGFEIVERLERYYPRGQNAVAMRKKLAP